MGLGVYGICKLIVAVLQGFVPRLWFKVWLRVLLLGCSVPTNVMLLSMI